MAPRTTASAVLTHPEFVRAVIRIIKSREAFCAVGDSPAVGPAEIVASIGGIKKVCQQENVPIIDLKTPLKINTPDGRIAKSLFIAREIYKFDKIISLPKLKNHSLTGITGAVKNLYGVIPGLRKAKYHFRFKSIEEFSSLLIELNLRVKPCMNIVDGIIGMQGDGPNSGDPKKMGLIIMGDNTVAVDYIASTIMNYNPDDIPFIKIAKNYKFGGYQKNLINVKGESLKKSIVKDFKVIKPRKSPEMGSGFLRKVIINLIIKKPVIIKNQCIGCEECAKICPAKTITLIDKKAVISYNKCIKCYCCSEVCSQNAIKLKIKPFTISD